MSSNKPFPSSDLDVFKDNSLILDNFVNSQDNEYPDRFGRKRPTISGIIKEAFSVRTDISNMNETLIGQSRWDAVPKNTSLTLGGDNGALNKQAQALFNRTEMLKVHFRETLCRAYREVGLNLVEGSFEEGGVLNTIRDVLLEEKTGKVYSWTGSFPKVVNKGTLPDSEVEWSEQLFNPHIKNIKVFGAKGDGITDDTNSINVAFSSECSELFFPSGKYYFTGQLNINKPLKIVSNGIVEFIFLNSTGNTIIVNSDDVIFSGIKFSGSTPGGVSIGRSREVKNIIFDKCVFNNIGQCVWVFKAQNILVNKCLFDGTGYGVIQQKGHRSDNVIVSECIFQNMGGDCIEANCTTAGASKNWIVSNNIFKGSSGYPILATEKRFFGSTKVDNIIITGNIIENASGDAAIHIEENGDRVVVSNNIFINCLGSGGNSGTIYLLTSKGNVIVSDNYFKWTDIPDDVYVAAIGCNSGTYSGMLEFKNNIVEGRNKYDAQVSGVLGHFCGNLNVSENLFLNINAALQFGSSSFIRFTNNKIIGANKCAHYGRTASSGVGSDHLYSGNMSSDIAICDYELMQNSNGTGCGKNFVFVGNYIWKKIIIHGQVGGPPGTNQDMQNVSLLNNILAPGSSIDTSGTRSNFIEQNTLYQEGGNIVSQYKNFADDQTAAAGGVPINGMYRTGSVVKVRII